MPKLIMVLGCAEIGESATRPAPAIIEAGTGRG